MVTNWSVRSLKSVLNLAELLPGIEEFLVKALARERLAPATEKKRLFFVERLEVIKMPPSLPPSRDHRLTGQSNYTVTQLNCL